MEIVVHLGKHLDPMGMAGTPVRAFPTDDYGKEVRLACL
jgi:hypothetical protein